MSRRVPGATGGRFGPPVFSAIDVFKRHSFQRATSMEELRRQAVSRWQVGIDKSRL